MTGTNRLGITALFLAGILLAGGAATSFARTRGHHDSQKPLSALHSNGLAHHDFFYAGESKTERMFIVERGKIVWEYTHDGKGEISDAVLMKNGDILFAHQFAVTELSPDKRVVWNYNAPPNTEIHTAQPFGEDGVMFIENGDPAKAVFINKTTGVIEHEFTLPTGDSKNIHGQFRRARLTTDGTLLVAHMDLGKIVEYDLTGKQLWSVDAPGVWSVDALQDGNVLFSGNSNNYVREVNRKGETVWEFTAADAPGYSFDNMQTATRLPSGNTLITQWFNEWQGVVDPAIAPFQAMEVTPEKKVVWELRSWTSPNDLGPATTIQLMDEPLAIRRHGHSSSHKQHKARR